MHKPAYNGRARHSFAALLFPAVIGLILIGAFLFRDELTGIFRNPGSLEAWITGLGAQARAIFVAVQTFQVVIFIVPGEVVQIAGGYLFGIWEGALWSTLGIAIGAGVNYWVGRVAGRAFIERFLSGRALERFSRIAQSPKARLGFFLLFVIPGIPKDVLCYVAGGALMGFAGFLAISTIGRLPGILGSAVIGGTAAQEQWAVSLAVLAIATLLFLLGLIFRRRIEKLVARFTSLNGGPLREPDHRRGSEDA